jgi:hypothetical protein
LRANVGDRSPTAAAAAAPVPRLADAVDAGAGKACVVAALLAAGVNRPIITAATDRLRRLTPAPQRPLLDLQVCVLRVLCGGACALVRCAGGAVGPGSGW